MKVLLSLLVSVLLITTPATAPTVDEPSLATLTNRVSKSIVPLTVFLSETDGLYCTAFSISESYGLYLTTYHCLESEGRRAIRWEIEGHPAYPVQGFIGDQQYLFPNQNVETDLAVLVSSFKRPALLLGSVPHVEDKIVFAGYAGGHTRHLQINEGTVMQPTRTFIGDWRTEQLITRAIFTMGSPHSVRGGNSGGPILTAQGKVISMIAGTTILHGTSVGCGVLYGFIARIMANLPA